MSLDDVICPECKDFWVLSKALCSNQRDGIPLDVPVPAWKYMIYHELRMKMHKLLDLPPVPEEEVK
jgi:hypothetical protein